jgi:DNA polymerase/3'-5' exonuclease PolX
MSYDKLTRFLFELTKIEKEIKDLKKEIRTEEKYDNEDYRRLKQNSRDLNEQAKEMYENHLKRVRGTQLYKNINEALLAKADELTSKKEAVIKTLNELPKKPFAFDLDTEDGTVKKITAEPKLVLFSNGKLLKV